MSDDGDEPAPALFDRQASHPLTADERDEFEQLVLEYSRLDRDRELRRFADEHDPSVEQSRDRVCEEGGDIIARACGLSRRCRP